MTHQEAINKGIAYFKNHVSGNGIEEEKGFHMVEENEEFSIFLDNNTADPEDPALLNLKGDDSHKKFLDRYKTMEKNASYCEIIENSAYRVCAIPNE
ncbi:hypothetical protein ACFSQ3_12820 [Sphingobacterium corticis]|uniref:Uncharacterized protein n=1 Tax=Sphingobacterium corticis TaxID=1812823 RepID=A0ABW5NN54_9SPHI